MGKKMENVQNGKKKWKCGEWKKENMQIEKNENGENEKKIGRMK